MPILVCGSEGEWALFNNTLNTTGADDKRRGSVLIQVGNQMFKDFGETADCWVHCRFAGEGSTASGNQARTFLEIRDANGVTMLVLRDAGLSSTPQWAVNIGYQTAPDTNVSTFTTEDLPLEAFEFQDFDLRVQTTASDITFSVYRNGQLRFNRTITGTGFNGAAQLLLRERNDSTLNNFDHIYYQDVIVTDALPTVGMELATLVPAAVGNYNDFANDYTNIDDFGYDASTVISTSTVDDRESWIFATPTFDLGDKVIYGVVLDTVAQTDLGAIIGDFQMFLRISATNYAGGNLGANNINPDSYVIEFTTNPATGQPWQQSELSALEAGVRAI